MLRVAIPIAVLCAVDGTCSGLRASFGRSGLIRHQAQDRVSAAVGLVAVLVLLTPAAVSFLVAVTVLETPATAYTDAGRAVLVVVLPYAAVVAVALAAYGLLSWRRRYLAMAVILGPGTLVRPLVAVGAVTAAAVAARQWPVTVTLALGLAAVLTIEPLVGRLRHPVDPRS